MSRTMEAETASATELYERDGFFFAPPIVPLDLVRRACDGMDAVMRGEYETGVNPGSRAWNPGDDPKKICKIDNAQLCNRAILDLISHPAIGAWAARLTGAKMVQVWSTQLLFKPPGGADEGNVGWHQDYQYWKYWEGEVFTAWVALCDVKRELGPVKFVRGSNHWGPLEGGDFFSGNLAALQKKFAIPAGAEWEEVDGVLPAGGVSFHHRFTIHGSGPNLSSVPRRSFALHIRTEKSKPVPGVKDHGYASHLDDPIYCPVIYKA
ncbi:MAG: phytanoyl-CoA dioxygenase family protein [Planctomycetes bacterium]|nr:phytanoyl-CoA dioxygenase family protein [Planctomycetota bacterium]